MSPSSKKAVNKACATLFGVAFFALVSTLFLAFTIPSESFDRQTPLAMLVNILGVVGMFSVAAAAGIYILAAASRVAESETTRSTLETATKIARSASDARRPKLTSTSGMSTADELEKWARLRDSGIVTQEEFESARKELLKVQPS